MKTMRAGITAKRLTIALMKPLPTDMAAGNRERAALYHSARWLRRRKAFLAEHPLCQTCLAAGQLTAATVVDHVAGHARRDWREQFWIEEQWQGCCQACHAAKSAKELAEWRRQAEGAREA